MTINLNIPLPADCFERLMSALERIADSAERIAGPRIEPTELKPYPASDWGYSSNAQSREQELLEKQEATGYGQAYRYEIESRAYAASRPPNGADIDQGRA